MRAQEAKRTQKVLDGLLKVHQYLKAEKSKQALKSLESLVGKLKKKLEKKPTKRPATGYSLFVKENYKKVAKENPKATTVEVMKLIGKLYRSTGAKKPSPPKAPKKTASKAKSPKPAKPAKKPAAKRVAKK